MKSTKDSSDSAKLNDSNIFFMDCHEVVPTSRNDGNRTPFCDFTKYHATNRKTILTIIKWQDSTQNSRICNDKRKSIP